MKKRHSTILCTLVLAVVVSVGLGSSVSAQEPTKICDGCEFEWDAPTNLTDIVEYRFYLASESGEHDFDAPSITIPVAGTTTTTAALAPGTWYAVVTSATAADLQSLPSNEVKFIAPTDPGTEPTNLVIRITLTADGNLSVEIERVACLTPVKEE